MGTDGFMKRCFQKQLLDFSKVVLKYSMVVCCDSMPGWLDLYMLTYKLPRCRALIFHAAIRVLKYVRV